MPGLGRQSGSTRWITGTIRALVASATAAAVLAVPALTATAQATPRSTTSTATGRGAVVDSALTHARGTAHIIVQKYAGVGHAPEAAVRHLGGQVTRELSIVHGFAAHLPARAIHLLAAVPGVRVISLDAKMHVQALPTVAAQGNNLPSVYRKVVGADKLANVGANGHGVTVALIDTGVDALPDLAGRIVTVTTDPLGLTTAPCVNFSGESTCDDSYGHGTFIAGLIAGNGTSNHSYVGAAPQAQILSIKLAGADGSADVSKVLAALQWIVSFKDTYGIQVANLSLGTDSTQSYRVDPLNYAVEQAWKAGITVVVAASNRGPGAETISKPGDDPFVITVGASDDNGTNTLNDDAIPAFTSRGPTASDGLAKPDVMAPGTHLVSLAAPNASITNEYPSTMAAPYRRGSGTSFANGVVAGVVADMLSGNPSLTPDRIKFALMSTARAYPGADPMLQGAGVISGYSALFTAPAGLANQGQAWSDGSGSLELSRGTVHVDAIAADGTVTTLTGDQTATASLTVYDPINFLGTIWTSASWWTSEWGNNWSGNNWSGNNWSGNNWSGNNWSGNNWSGTDWTGNNWSGNNWSGNNWSDNNWYGNNWSGSAWYGAWDQ